VSFRRFENARNVKVFLSEIPSLLAHPYPLRRLLHDHELRSRWFPPPSTFIYPTSGSVSVKPPIAKTLSVL